jgi:cell division protein YceG involved in septum cleavage
MPKAKKQKNRSLRTFMVRASSVAAVLVFILVSFVAIGLLKTKEVAFETAAPLTPVEDELSANVFPIGVDPLEESIIENPLVDTYFAKHITVRPKKTPRDGWFHQVLAMLTQYDWYQNLASPISRILVVDSGERREEVLRNFSQILKWTDEEELTFATLVAGSSPNIPEGKFTPGHYVVNKDATPEEVAHLILEQFDSQVLSRYPEKLQEVVSIEDALTLASILEREAYDFEDMRYIAGVVWNRLFIGMDLQIDATLQYAKANGPSATWWPTVVPADKYINSPFNTYQNEGLPPTPIANPSTEAILAALNPKKTDCIFYFHDAEGGFHCNATYDAHVAELKEYYGKGR